MFSQPIMLFSASPSCLPGHFKIPPKDPLYAIPCVHPILFQQRSSPVSGVFFNITIATKYKALPWARNPPPTLCVCVNVFDLYNNSTSHVLGTIITPHFTNEKTEVQCS